MCSGISVSIRSNPLAVSLTREARRSLGWGVRSIRPDFCSRSSRAVMPPDDIIVAS